MNHEDLYHLEEESAQEKLVELRFYLTRKAEAEEKAAHLARVEVIKANARLDLIRSILELIEED
tara:strand:+ start:434 stop:625 length:192 start_codon:yes stop_codon:yes gene_type:complete